MRKFKIVLHHKGFIKNQFLIIYYRNLFSTLYVNYLNFFWSYYWSEWTIINTYTGWFFYRCRLIFSVNIYLFLIIVFGNSYLFHYKIGILFTIFRSYTFLIWISIFLILYSDAEFFSEYFVYQYLILN